MNEIAHVPHNAPELPAGAALLNITWAGQNGWLPDPVRYDAADAELRGFATEALLAGGIAGIARAERVDLTDFVVDRFPGTAEVPVNRLFLRPKTPFGGLA
jgi:hypothetical protein